MSDILKDLTNYRIKGIEKAEIEYYKQLTQTLDRIEAQIVSLADTSLPRTAGKLIELQSAVAIRPKIKAILDKEYLPFADRVVRKGFGEQAKRVERQFKTIGLIPPEFQELTKGDLALVQNLKKQYYTQFKDVSNNFTRILSDKVYQNTLVGTEFTVLEKELRQSINGIYATSNDPAVNRLVDYVKNNKDNPALASRVDDAVKILQTKYASTRVGENMKRYAGQILNDSLRDFDATLNFNKAKDAGLEYVKYYGDVIPTTRDHCRNMINGVYDKSGKNIYTIDEINRIWNSTSWSGKKGGTPMVSRGGYNCRHQFSYVNPDWYEEDGDESDILKEVTPIVKKQQKANVSSFVNPIVFTNIKPVSIKESKARLKKTINDGLNDSRYPRKQDGEFHTRFKDTRNSIGKITVANNVTDQELTIIATMMDELNDLAKKYNIPKLRGIKVKKNQSYNMAMGDGVLNVSTYYVKRVLYDPTKKLTTKSWSYGENVVKRPFSVKEYLDNGFERFRSTMYHEFGHHVHQMKYIGADDILTGKFLTKVENQTKDLFDKLKKEQGKFIGNSEYGDTIYDEWFAEQFAMFHLNKLDKVHPEFKKLIKEIEDEVAR